MQGGRHLADDALGGIEDHRARIGGPGAPAGERPEPLVALVVQHDRDSVGVEQPGRVLGDDLHQRLELGLGVDLAVDFAQDVELARQPLMPLPDQEQPDRLTEQRRLVR